MCISASVWALTFCFASLNAATIKPSDLFRIKHRLVDLELFQIAFAVEGNLDEAAAVPVTSMDFKLRLHLSHFLLHLLSLLHQ